MIQTGTDDPDDETTTAELRILTADDVAAHCEGEDDSTVRWLTKQRGTPESTRAHFDRLDRNVADGRGKIGFGVWSDGRLAGYVDCDPDVPDLLEDGDVNVTYAVHPWARGRGLAVAAVHLLCDYLVEYGIGHRAVIRVEPDNSASVRVAEKAGFAFVRTVESTTDTDENGHPVLFDLFVRPLGRSSGG